MRLFQKSKDGGPKSPVDAYFLCEFKGLFSVALLKFNKGKREQYHTHAFNALTWFIKGGLVEQKFEGGLYNYERSLLPKFTPRENNHRLINYKDSWCITLRGPWKKHWTETDESCKVHTTFTHSRQIVGTENY